MGERVEGWRDGGGVEMKHAAYTEANAGPFPRSSIASMSVPEVLSMSALQIPLLILVRHVSRVERFPRPARYCISLGAFDVRHTSSEVRALPSPLPPLLTFMPSPILDFLFLSGSRCRRPWCKCISGRGGHARARSRRPRRTVPAVRGERPRAGPSPIPFPPSFFVGVGDIGEVECAVDVEASALAPRGRRVLDPEQDVVVEWELVVEVEGYVHLLPVVVGGVRTSGSGLASGRCRRATWVSLHICEHSALRGRAFLLTLCISS
jgi:hypothetical protein